MTKQPDRLICDRCRYLRLWNVCTKCGKVFPDRRSGQNRRVNNTGFWTGVEPGNFRTATEDRRIKQVIMIPGHTTIRKGDRRTDWKAKYEADIAVEIAERDKWAAKYEALHAATKRLSVALAKRHPFSVNHSPLSCSDCAAHTAFARIEKEQQNG